MEREYKAVDAEIKALDDQGAGVLRFIRFHQEDKDADVTLPGFIGQQQAVLLVGHNWKSDHPPLGRGESFEADGATNFRFQLNLDDPRVKTWYSWLKMDQRSGRPLQQVSYGFSPYADGQEKGQKDGKPVRFLKPRADGTPGAKLHEVSLVTVGSGNDQGVLLVKAFEELPDAEELAGEVDDLKAAGVQVQSLIFPKDKWESAEAVRSWLRSHDYSTSVESTGSSWRARQKPPGDFQRLRSFCINPSREASNENCRVMAVGGPMKESRSVEPAHTTVAAVNDGKRVIGPHTTPTDERPWNFAIEHRQIKALQSGGFYRNLYAVQDPGKENQRANYRYLHHRVQPDGTPGAASVIACAQILHALHKGFVPSDERTGIYAHVAQHLRDAGIDPPALGDLDSYVYPYDEEAQLFLWHADDLLQQTSNIQAFRARKGLTLTQERLEQFAKMDEKWSALRLLLSMKGLDRPLDEIVDRMTVEARGEAVAQRVAEVVDRGERQARQAQKEMTESFVSRIMTKLS
jgi:hypothetical protein